MKKQFKNFSCDRTFKKLVGGKQNFLIRKGSDINQIIFGDNHYLFATENKNFPKNKLYLFKMVNDDVKKFIDNNPFIDLPPQKKKVVFKKFSYIMSVLRCTHRVTHSIFSPLLLAFFSPPCYLDKEVLRRSSARTE
jgi:hypothetical protein